MSPPLLIYLCTTVHIYSPSRTLRSTSDASNLRIPRCKLSTVGSRSFSEIGPSALNKLPLSLRQTPTLSTFTSNVKTSFLTSVGLSSLLFVFVCPRPCVDCCHPIDVGVLSKCPRMTASEGAKNCLGQDSEPFKLLNYDQL